MAHCSCKINSFERDTIEELFAKPDKSTLPGYAKNEIFGFVQNWDFSGFARKLFFMFSLVS